jgi:cytochrome c-type biogenesis protein CcmH/NrfG
MTPEQRRGNILSLEKMVASNPGNVKAWNQLGHLYIDSNQPGQGIKAFKKVVELDPENAHAWTDLGIMHQKNGQPVEAIAAYGVKLVYGTGIDPLPVGMTCRERQRQDG